jgi:hypothetical protein
MAALGVLSRVDPYETDSHLFGTSYFDGLITYSDGTQEVIPNKQKQINEHKPIVIDGASRQRIMDELEAEAAAAPIEKRPVAVATAANTPSSEELLRDIRNLLPPLNENEVNSIIGAYNAVDLKKAFFEKYPLTSHKFNVANILFNSNGEKKNKGRLSIGGHKRKSHRRKSHRRKSHRRKSHKRKVK